MTESSTLSDLSFDPNYEETPTPPCQERAEDHLRLVAYWRQQSKKRQTHAQTQSDRIALWLEREQERINRRIAWHESALQGFLWQTGKKSVRLIHGAIRRIKGREKVEILDEEAFLSHAASDLVRVRTQRQPDKKAIIAHIRQTGEIPAGTDLVCGDDTIHIETEV